MVKIASAAQERPIYSADAGLGGMESVVVMFGRRKNPKSI